MLRLHRQQRGEFLTRVGPLGPSAALRPRARPSPSAVTAASRIATMPLLTDSNAFRANGLMTGALEFWGSSCFFADDPVKRRWDLLASNPIEE